MHKIPVYYHPGFAAPIGEGHMMPIRKFALVAEGLHDQPAAEWIEPAPAAVFEFARSAGIPIAWVLAGGYTADVRKVVQVTLNTFAACREVCGSLSAT